MFKEPMMILILIFILSSDFSGFYVFYDILLSVWIFWFFFLIKQISLFSFW